MWEAFHRNQEYHLLSDESHKVYNLNEYYLMDERLLEAIELRARVL